MHYRFTRSAENIPTVSESVVEDLNVEPGISFVLRHIMTYFAFRSIPTSI